MSAEREVFKQMGRLAEQKKIFLNVVDDSARRLMRVAIREFVLEHPEVESLNWEPHPQEFSTFFIRINRKVYQACQLEKTDPKLSKCLEILEANCRKFPEALREEFGVNDVSITQEIAKNIGV